MTADRRTALWLLLIGVGWSACFHHTRDWNSASRLLLSHAMVQTHSIEVTPFVAVHGQLVRNPPTRDLASPDGQRYFSDKAPGQSLLGAAALPLLKALKVAADHPLATDSIASQAERLSLRRTDYLLTVATSGVCAGLAAAVVYLLLRRWNVGATTAAAAALALEFASPWQAYGALYYGHVAAGLFAVLAVWFFDADFDSSLRRLTAAFLAGLFAGLAVLVEYTMATLVISIVLAAAITALAARGRSRGRWDAAVAFLLGGLGPAMWLGWYHWRVTGDPFVPAYRYEVERDFAAVHAKGSGIPLSTLQPGAIFELPFGSSIGLVLFAPAVVWAVVGIVRLISARPRVGWTALFSVVFLLIVVACFPNWNGGLATGPRFLSPSLPVLFAAAGVAWDLASKQKVGRFLLAISTPIVVGAAILNTAMNAAGARKPFDLSINEFLRLSFGAPDRERHMGDWLLSILGVHASAVAAFAILAALAAVPIFVVLRRTR